ncbi:MAG: NAD(P)H-hydrate dehydratase [Eubacterium sp.]|nr:NAD(P)H-hydrate dehydratase [Eubacterium sp.]
MRMILNADQAKSADVQASERGIPSIVLMEKAASAFVDEFLAAGVDPDRTIIVCGTGNNAGDGVAAARILSEKGYRPKVFYAGDPEKYSAQMKQQIQMLEIYDPDVTTQLSEFHPEEAEGIIDAIFGIGMKRDITGSYREIIERINEAHDAGVFVASVDMPSGIHTDTGAVCGCAVKADLTVTFTAMKTGLCLYPGAAYAGKTVVREIGIPILEPVLSGIKVFAIDEEDVRKIPKRDETGNKGTFGKVLVAAGSREIFGAAYLAARAALMTGIGMVRVYTHEKNRTALSALLPEALITTYEDGHAADQSLDEAIAWSDGILIGPGLGTGEDAKKILQRVMREEKRPIIYDADAINLLSKDRTAYPRFGQHSVMTPHIGEMARFTGISVSDIKADPIGIARDAAEQTGAVIVLKDARSVICEPTGKTFINLSGCSALATAGSGDVLAGITAGLVTQYKEVQELHTEALAAFIHGRAGERAGEELTEDCVTAGSLFGYFPDVLRP